METANASIRKIFISGNILDETLNAIMKNGFECSIVPNGGGFTITYDDNNLRFQERLLEQKEKEYNEVSNKVFALRKEYSELMKKLKKDDEK